MNKIAKIFTLGLITVTGLSSCEKFLDVNTNPNAPSKETISLSAKFPAALVATVNQEQGQINQIGAFWGGYWGTTNQAVNSFIDLKSYNGLAIMHQRDGIPVWETAYNNLFYLELIKKEALEENALFYAGAAKIMQGWLFLRLVDMYNNVPFDEALRGFEIATPKYEPGKTVYEKSINLISSGIADIKNHKDGPGISKMGTDDIMFKGVADLWYKFGNTIKLRALIRQSEAGNQTYIDAEIAKIVAEGSGFLSVSENAHIQPGYLNSSGKLNPFWENYYKTVQGRATANYTAIRPTVYAIDKYKSLNDPRLANLYVTIAGEYKGVLFGNPNSNDPIYGQAVTSAFKGPAENANKPGALFKSFSQASVLMGSFESLFLQAEAAERGWISGNAKTLYENAIKESFKYMEVVAGDFTAYNAQASVNYSTLLTKAEKIERIIEQKWLALNSISSIEAWNDYRRLNLPNIPNSLDAPSPTSRPLRLMYPETERMTNNEEASKQGNDDMLTGKIWWMK